MYGMKYVRAVLDHVHNTPEEFENGDFALKTHQMFFLHTAPEEFKNTTITGHFGFVFEENSLGEITSFSKSSVFEMFSVHSKGKAGVFKFIRFEERFRKAPFS